MVGSSSSECDTIPGRQCMASSLFLEERYDEVSLYLSSIKSYFSNDDSFNYNFAQVFLILIHFLYIHHSVSYNDEEKYIMKIIQTIFNRLNWHYASTKKLKKCICK